MKIYWFAYRQLLFINIPISAVLSLNTPNYFPIVFGIFGYLCSLFLYQYFYKNVWYIYLNIGYTKTKIHIGAFLINLGISITLSPIIWLLK